MMVPSSNSDTQFYANIPTRFSHVISYVDFNQDDETHIDGHNNNGTHIDDHNKNGTHIDGHSNKELSIASPFFVQQPSRQQSQQLSRQQSQQPSRQRSQQPSRQQSQQPSRQQSQQPSRQQSQQPIPTPKRRNSSLTGSSSLKDSSIQFNKERDGDKLASAVTDDDVKQSRTDSTPPGEIPKIIPTSEHSQQTSPIDMSIFKDDNESDKNNNSNDSTINDNDDNNNNLTVLNEIDNNNNNNNNNNNSTVSNEIDNHNNNSIQHQRKALEQINSINGSMKRSISDEHILTLPVDNEEEPSRAVKSILTKPKNETKPKNGTKPIPKIKQTTKISPPLPSMFTKYGQSSSSIRWDSPKNTPRTLVVVPSMTHRAVQGVLVRFFRNGDEYHPGVQVAVNESDLKSWEAFLNYLNRQNKLALSTGGIKHVYTLNGQEIHSINQFQHRQSYVVSSGGFIRTNYRFANDSFSEEVEPSTSLQQDMIQYWNTRSSVYPRWRSQAPPNGEQIYLLPYSKLNMYESIILNRNLSQKFEEWLQDQVTDLLSHYTNNENISHLFGVTKSSFIEVKSFSKLFNMLKMTNTFIGCTADEYVHARHYLGTMKPQELFTDRIWPRRVIDGDHHRYLPRRAIEDAKLSLNWVHGYYGEHELTRTLYTLPENEILYIIGSVCIIYDPNLKHQRFYTKHDNLITCINVHQCQSLVASSEIASSRNNRRALIHIWDHIKLRVITELRKEQFGSYISLLSFSPRLDDNLLLVISRDKPKVVLFIDWNRNELIYSITCKSDNIISVLFAFDTNEWIACLSHQHLLFYHINWSVRPLKVLEQREAEVQNIYTGAATCDISGERLLVGDKVGSIHVWRLIDDEPKLFVVQESILENDIEIIIPISHETFVVANREDQIKIWNAKLNTVEQIELSGSVGSIQSICCIQRASSSIALAIGTKLNYIISKEIRSEQSEIIMRGHTSPSVCICCDRNSQYFFSISSDRHLFKWNNTTKSVEWSAKSNQPISCADLHPERNIIVLGTETSKLVIYDTLSSYYIATITLKMNTGVKSVRFSPDGSGLAVGLLNGNVCVYDVLGNGDFRLRTNGILQNDTAPVDSVIWSIDSKYLLVVYTDNDFNIWSLLSFEIIKGKSIENIRWHHIVHPIMCNILDKSAIDTHSSAIILTENLVLCCGKDGELRLFRNRYERKSQTFDFGLGPVQNINPSTKNNRFLLSMNHIPVIVEIQVNINSHLS